MFACGSCKAWERQNKLLLTQITDLQEAYSKLTEDSEARYQTLMDRFMSVTQPSAMRELARSKQSYEDPKKVSGKRSTNFPLSSAPARPAVVASHKGLFAKPPEQAEAADA